MSIASASLVSFTSLPARFTCPITGCEDGRRVMAVVGLAGTLLGIDTGGAALVAGNLSALTVAIGVLALHR